MADISKKAIAVLVVIAIVLSIIATWTMLSIGPQIEVVEDQKEGSGNVRVAVLPGPSVEQGNVKLVISG